MVSVLMKLFWQWNRLATNPRIRAHFSVVRQFKHLCAFGCVCACVPFTIFKIYWHCLRPSFVLLIILWQNKHTTDPQFIFHANDSETIFKCRASFYICMCVCGSVFPFNSVVGVVVVGFRIRSSENGIEATFLANFPQAASN